MTVDVVILQYCTRFAALFLRFFPLPALIEMLRSGWLCLLGADQDAQKWLGSACSILRSLRKYNIRVVPEVDNSN